MSTIPNVSSSLSVERVRHPIHVRRLRVQRIDRLSANFVRIRFEGEALKGFVSASFDDHLKLMLPTPGRPLVLPEAGPDGLVMPAGVDKPPMRDYTPRHFDATANTLDIEFVLHGDDGLASHWAANATPGDEVGIGGPRGSFVVPTGFDWHLLVGDETALPAIARRLEELPATARAIVVTETADADDQRQWSSRAQVESHRLRAGETGALAEAVRSLTLPAGEGFAWAAGEAASTAAVRLALVAAHGLDKARVRVSAYWKRGAPGHHETL